MNFGGLEQRCWYSASLRAGQSRFERRCRQNFPDLYRQASRTVQAPVKWAPGLSRGGKAAWE